MCGIIGVLNLTDRPPVDPDVLCRMLATIRHRGPDEFGIYRDPWIGMGSARLSIIDLASGQQPIANEDGSLWIVFNGEIYNYIELRSQLEEQGHRFATNTDTEVLLHLYEDLGSACLHQLNGQFAIAIWNEREHTLFLARDRLGIRPLFYTVQDGRLIFGSEIKALLAHPDTSAEIAPSSLEQVFTFWSTLSPYTVFRDIYEVPPAHYLQVRDGQFTLHPYWELDFAPGNAPQRTDQEYLEEFEDLLIDATRIRLRADVPVGAYLSGGLDSSVTAALIRNYTDNRLDTFSIAFDDPAFDESPYQEAMARFLGTHHRITRCSYADIARVFPDVIWHTETPILRTSPAPMFLLSQLVREHGLKVVLTGEGADEFLAGYNIFKEMKVRRFWAKAPDSHMRPLLLDRLYPYVPDLHRGGRAYRTAFFRKGLTDTDSPFYSHAIRWMNMRRARRFLLQHRRDAHAGDGETYPIPLPPSFSSWSHLGQAQYLEIVTFLSPYLLSSQGDRMAMAHSVEGRFPFLDHRVVEFCNRLPPRLKLRGLTEKWLLKQLGRKLLPDDIWKRPKQPYRAPIHPSFFAPSTPEYVRELLSDRSLKESHLFHPAAVAQLVRKAEQGRPLSEIEDMALVGILSTQLVYEQFVKRFRPANFNDWDRLKVVDHTQPIAAASERAAG